MAFQQFLASLPPPLRTLAQRRRVDVAKYTEALNTPIQGTGADGMKSALARLFAHRAEVPDARLIMCVHDEIVAECPQEQAAQTAAWLQHHMTAVMTDILNDAVPVVVETTIGQGLDHRVGHFRPLRMGSSQGAQLEVYTLHSPLDAIQQR